VEKQVPSPLSPRLAMLHSESFTIQSSTEVELSSGRVVLTLSWEKIKSWKELTMVKSLKCSYQTALSSKLTRKSKNSMATIDQSEI
jgi:hypothetical protein